MISRKSLSSVWASSRASRRHRSCISTRSTTQAAAMTRTTRSASSRASRPRGCTCIAS
ncbi:hypothetical protein BN1723_020661 [Verticillium longisporum]|uniref:Uncharacterized protein n=1 Tax=Verticillium longisporum TaxID=100787 RepID=A0A0G4NQV6_VERLO|nr:hypothetical protein BN1723_020661 [Verticillium longisporum]